MMESDGNARSSQCIYFKSKNLYNRLLSTKSDEHIDKADAKENFLKHNVKFFQNAVNFSHLLDCIFSTSILFSFKMCFKLTIGMLMTKTAKFKNQRQFFPNEVEV